MDYKKSKVCGFSHRSSGLVQLVFDCAWLAVLEICRGGLNPARNRGTGAK